MLCCIYKHCSYLTAPFAQSLVRLFKIKLLNITKAWKIAYSEDPEWYNMMQHDVLGHTCVHWYSTLPKLIFFYYTNFFLLWWKKNTGVFDLFRVLLMDSYEYRKTKNVVKIHSKNFQSVLKNQIKIKNQTNKIIFPYICDSSLYRRGTSSKKKVIS